MNEKKRKLREIPQGFPRYLLHSLIPPQKQGPILQMIPLKTPQKKDLLLSILLVVNRDILINYKGL